VPDDDQSPAADVRLRVLLVMADSTGGIGAHVTSLAQGLPERGGAVTICAPAATIAALGLDLLDVVVVPAPLDRATPSAIRRASQVLRREAAKVDIVHAHGLRAGAAVAAFVPAAPLIVTWHNAALGNRWWRKLHAVLSRYVAHSTELTLAASEDLASEARAAGAIHVRTTFVVAPTAVATRTELEVRVELGVADRPVVLAIGRLQHQKRLDVLVEAAAVWARTARSPVVLIVGEGPERAVLAAQIAASGAPARLLGQRADVADLLLAADLVALPSEWEAKSLVAQEALRAGVPLITTAVGGLPSLLGDAAVYVPVGDAAALSAAIEDVLADPGDRQRLVELGLERARGWPDAQQVLDELIHLYLDLTDRMRRDRD
jgi:glycosyltransferase involved in cell wall biosynthesis